MRLYDPDVIYLALAVIAGGAIMTAALVWAVALAWPWPHSRSWPHSRPRAQGPALPAEGPALPDEIPEGTGAPTASSRR